MTEPGRRLHPLSPLLSGGKALTALLVVFAQGLRRPDLRVTGLLVLVVVAVTVLAGVLSWRATRYRLTATELQVDSGVLRRRARRVPLARLQSVDVVRPFVARVLGLAELRLEVVGGGRGSEAPLAYLRQDEAELLRGQLLARAAGSTEQKGTEQESPEPAEQVLVRVPTSALVGSVLLGAPAIATGLLVLAVVPVLIVSPAAAAGLVGALAPVAIGTGGLLVRRLLAEYGFTVAEHPDGLRLRHGLLETRAQTIPAGRVQTVRILEPLLWRRRGWVRVEVDVAGYAAGREQQVATTALLPVAPREFALAVTARVLSGPLPADPVRAPAAARWRAPLSAGRLGVAYDARHLLATHGVLTTTTDLVPLAKVQSLRLVQGPWQRRLGLASLSADSAGRRLTGAVARHRGAAEAEQLLAELTALARQARALPPPGPAARAPATESAPVASAADLPGPPAAQPAALPPALRPPP